MNCTCANLEDKSLICEFCTDMLWAAQFEENLKIYMTENYVDEKQLEDYLTEDEIEYKFEQNYVKSDDLEGEIERYINDANIIDKDELDSYVAKDDLEEAIEESLNESEIVKEVASGVVEGAMRLLTQYAPISRVNELEFRIRTLESTIEKLNSKLEEKSKSSPVSRFFHFLTYNKHGE